MSIEITDLLGARSFYDFAGRPQRLSDQSAAFQDFLADVEAYSWRVNANTTYDDQLLASPKVTARINSLYSTTSPLIVPPGVCLDMPAGLTLAGHSQLNGAVVSSFTGDPTVKGLSNPYQPMIIIPHGASCKELQINLNNGTDSVSGFALGKNWLPTAWTIVSRGTGHAVNDIISPPQPHRSPYIRPQIRVDSVDGSGAILTYTVLIMGVYAVPSGYQKRYYTAANGWTGAVANQAKGLVWANVATGEYATSSTGAGVGASFTATWKPDFAGTGSDYDFGAVLQGNMRTGGLTYTHAGKAIDGTYGRQFGVSLVGLQFHIPYLSGGGGYYGINLTTATDVHISKMTPIGSEICLNIRYGASIECPAFEPDTWGISAAEIDGARNVTLKGHGLSAGDMKSISEGIKLGSHTTDPALGNSMISLDFTLPAENTNSASAPAVFGDFTRNSDINVRVGNRAVRNGTMAAFPFTHWGRFGTNWDASNVCRGSIDDGHIAVIKDTPPDCTIDIWDKRAKARYEARDHIPINMCIHPRVFNSGQGNISGLTVADEQLMGADGAFRMALVTTTAANQYVRSQSISTTAHPDSISGTTNRVLYSKDYKPGTATVFEMYVGDSGGTSYFKGVFSCSAAGVFFTNSVVVGADASFISYGIKRLRNGIYRVWVYGIPGVAGLRPGLRSGSTTGYGTQYTDRWCIEVNPVSLKGDYIEPLPMSSGSSPFGPILTALDAVNPILTTIAIPQGYGDQFVVSGVNGANRFTDVVTAGPAGSVVVVSSGTAAGAPPAGRTYAVTTGALQLSLPAGTVSYAVRAKRMGAASL